MYIWFLFFNKLFYFRFSLFIFVFLWLWSEAWNGSQVQQQIIAVKDLLEILSFAASLFYHLSNISHQTISDYPTSVTLKISYGEKSTKEIELSNAFPNHWVPSESKERIYLNKNWSGITEIIRFILVKSKLTMRLERKAKYLQRLHSLLALHLLLASNFCPLGSKHIAFVLIAIA